MNPRIARAWRWIALPLLLGLFTTIAVCWGIAAWLPQRGWQLERTTFYPTAESWLSVWFFRTTGAERRSWSYDWGARDRVRNPFGYKSDIKSPREVADSGLAPFHLSWPSWGDLPRELQEPDDGFNHATGFPVLAGWYAAAIQYSPQGSGRIMAIGGVELSPAGPVNLGAMYNLRALPLRPIWIGLLIDTLFYGVIWAGLLAGGRGLRSRFRRRRNRCVRCNYSLAGLPTGAACPECGSPTGAGRHP